MKISLYLFIIILPFYVSGQVVSCRIIDSRTKRPVSNVTISNSSGQAITFSNEEGLFAIRESEDTARIKISCLGYATRILQLDSLRIDSVITLHQIAYSLPPVFVGNYALSLIKSAYRKANSLKEHYYFGKGFDLQLFWINHKPRECYEFLQNLKLSTSGLAAREIKAARHGLIPDSIYSGSFMNSLRQFAEQLNWYYNKRSLKKRLKNYDYTVEKLIYQDSNEIAKVHFEPKKPKKHLQKEGYFYIDTHTFDVLRYTVSAFIPKISIPLLAKLYNLNAHLVQNFNRNKPYPRLANTSISIEYLVSHKKQLDTIQYQDKFYVLQPVPWNNNIVFTPTSLNAKNKKIFKKSGDTKWNAQLPVILSDVEKKFLQYIEKHNAF